MRDAGWKSLIFFGFSLITPVLASAQPVAANAESIESLIANADLVLIGKLAKFRGEEQGVARSGHEATFAVEDTLKQNVMNAPYRQLSIYIPRRTSVLADWKKRSSRLLVAYSEYAPREPTVIELVPDSLEIMRSDFTVIRDPKAVIKAAREIVRRMPAEVKRIHTFRLKVPREVAVGTQWETYYNNGAYLKLNVPVDKRLESWAHKLIRSPSPQKREDGARALRHFKSDENIAIIKPLLEDSEFTRWELDHESNRRMRVYGVRLEAYQTLKNWGIDVEQPLLRAEDQ